MSRRQQSHSVNGFDLAAICFGTVNFGPWYGSINRPPAMISPRTIDSLMNG
jgi:hypothetical protein